jgi:cell division protein ZapA (FtsZ GTPase activity inhibitor)
MAIIMADHPEQDPLLEIQHDLTMLKQKVEKIEQDLEENCRAAKRQSAETEHQKTRPMRLVEG